MGLLTERETPPTGVLLAWGPEGGRSCQDIGRRRTVESVRRWWGRICGPPRIALTVVGRCLDWLVDVPRPKGRRKGCPPWAIR